MKTANAARPLVPAGAEKPDAVRNALAVERNAAQEARRRARDAEERLAIVTRRAEDVEAQLAGALDRNRRLEVALAKGVPADLVGLLRGETTEELAADADRLLAALRQPRTTTNGRNR